MENDPFVDDRPTNICCHCPEAYVGESGATVISPYLQDQLSTVLCTLHLIRELHGI